MIFLKGFQYGKYEFFIAGKPRLKIISIEACLFDDFFIDFYFVVILSVHSLNNGFISAAVS